MNLFGSEKTCGSRPILYMSNKTVEPAGMNRSYQRASRQVQCRQICLTASWNPLCTFRPGKWHEVQKMQQDYVAGESRRWSSGFLKGRFHRSRRVVARLYKAHLIPRKLFVVPRKTMAAFQVGEWSAFVTDEPLGAWWETACSFHTASTKRNTRHVVTLPAKT